MEKKKGVSECSILKDSIFINEYGETQQFLCSAPKGMAECVRKKEDAAGERTEEIGFAVIKNATVNKEDIIVQETLNGERIDLVNRHTFDTEALLIIDEVGNPDVLYRILNANKSKVIYLLPSAEYNDYVKRILRQVGEL